MQNGQWGAGRYLVMLLSQVLRCFLAFLSALLFLGLFVGPEVRTSQREGTFLAWLQGAERWERTERPCFSVLLILSVPRCSALDLNGSQMLAQMRLDSATDLFGTLYLSSPVYSQEVFQFSLAFLSLGIVSPTPGCPPSPLFLGLVF